MKTKEAMAIINSIKPKSLGQGFRVSFEKVEGSLLSGHYFPDKGEDLIPTEGEAWDLARRFADATSEDEYVHIYVTDHDFSPVKGYEEKEIRSSAYRLRYKK